MVTLESTVKCDEATKNGVKDKFFDKISTTPQWAAENSPSIPRASFDPVTVDTWDALRDSGLAPRFISDTSGCEAGRAEALEGFRLLGLNRQGPSSALEKYRLRPQQLWIADCMNAQSHEGLPAYEMIGVLASRRTAKTTSAIAVALGRCANPERGDYRVAFTLTTTRDKAAARFRKDIMATLERLYPEPASRPFDIRKGKGDESITWPHGASFEVVTPGADGFRSESYDLILIDEGQAADIMQSEDILAGALATMDTRPEASFVVLGTACEYRDGNLLVNILTAAQDGKARRGIVEYSAPEPVTAEDLESWEAAEALVLGAHPGISSGLTTIEAIQSRWESLKPASFIREYLSIHGRGGQVGGLFDLEAFAMAGLSVKFPRLPDHFALAMAVHPEQTCASLVAAWRVGGKARILVLKNERGVDWLAAEAAKGATKHRVPILYDDKGAVLVQVEKLGRMRPRPRLEKQQYREVGTAASLFISDVKNGMLQHYGQPSLMRAAEATIRRGSHNLTLFGRRKVEDDVTPIEAAALALRYYDATPKRAPLPRSTS